jgi:hypothetical protein
MKSTLSMILKILLIAPTTIPCAVYALIGIPAGLLLMLSGKLDNGLLMLLLPLSIAGLFGFIGLWAAVLTRGNKIMRANLVISIIYSVTLLGIALVSGFKALSKDTFDMAILTGITISLTACIVFSVRYLGKNPN